MASAMKRCVQCVEVARMLIQLLNSYLKLTNCPVFAVVWYHSESSLLVVYKLEHMVGAVKCSLVYFSKTSVQLYSKPSRYTLLTFYFVQQKLGIAASKCISFAANGDTWAKNGQGCKQWKRKTRKFICNWGEPE